MNKCLILRHFCFLTLWTNNLLFRNIPTNFVSSFYRDTRNGFLSHSLLTLKTQAWDAVRKCQMTLRVQPWDAMRRGETQWYTLGEINSTNVCNTMEIKKQCQYCGCSFIAHKMTTIYCSASCNNKDYKSKIREKQIAENQAQHPTPSPRVVKPTSTAKEFLTPTEGA